MINVKEYLRRHGFQFHKTVDRGAIWVLGDHKVMVLRDYTKKAFELRQLQESVKRGVDKFIHEKATKDAQFAKEVELAKERGEQLEAQQEKEAEEAFRTARRFPQTPEEHRADQLKAGAAMKDLEAVDVATLRASITKPAEEPQATATEKEKKTVGKIFKYKGEEREYVYGRIRYLIETKDMETGDILRMLKKEAVKNPDGKALQGRIISSVRTRWNKKPEDMDLYTPIEHGRFEARMKPVRQAPVAAPEPKKIPVRNVSDREWLLMAYGVLKSIKGVNSNLIAGLEKHLFQEGEDA